jgi:hypothetical protein
LRRRKCIALVWATDLWFDVSENAQRIRDAGVGDGVFPIHADARSLPFGADFFDAIAALSCARDVPGANRRTDVDDILRLLLRFGPDPNQRGINDYTPLHMAITARDALAVQIPS